MKSNVKKNLWDIVKYLLTLGVSAIVKLIKRKHVKRLEKKQGLQFYSDLASRNDPEEVINVKNYDQ